MVNYWITELEPPAGSPAGTRTEAYGVAPGGSAVGGYHTPGVGENSGEGAAVEWTSAGTIVLENPSPSALLTAPAATSSISTAPSTLGRSGNAQVIVPGF